ncbi:hypothetical protein [Thioalkalivibrio sp. ALJ1]|uniref:hypothetical protein n=1 Tax=Thioalkalivibrio sp. ALJ1 TaxID=1158144 RepID=UPI00056E3420|nr:hypothetical protein [Thioalkalivibrio sp. ALJ1]
MNTPSRSRTRLLIVSVGSLVGQNILDSLEYEEWNRRDRVHIIGTNSIASSPNNFRCDECYQVPTTGHIDYPKVMAQVLRSTQPDLILSARDADTAALWRLLDSNPALPGAIPYGNLETIIGALDKGKSAAFCKAHGLPFADTLVLQHSDDIDKLHAFASQVGYPMVAKPIEGFASKGVYFVRDAQEAEYFAQRRDYLFQEYLGPGDALQDYFERLDGPKPLFAEVPEVNHHTCHIPIAPDGRIGEIFVLHNHHHFGAVTRMQRAARPDLEELARRFAQAFIADGGAGALSVQFREDRNGNNKAQEMNLRTTGSTFARLMMGQDELGFLLNEWLPEHDFPRFSRSEPAYDLVVSKSLYSYSTWQDSVETLEQTGHWKAAAQPT